MPKFTDKWGREMARSRYGELPKQRFGGPVHVDNQTPMDRYGHKYDNPTPEDWRVGADESAEGKPGFDHSKKD